MTTDRDRAIDTLSRRAADILARHGYPEKHLSGEVGLGMLPVADVAALASAPTGGGDLDVENGRLRDLLARFRDFVVQRATQWDTSAGACNHHNPIWQEIADALQSPAPGRGDQQGASLKGPGCRPADETPAGSHASGASIPRAGHEARIEALENVLRELASQLGTGGYNAPQVDPDIFHRKIVDGIALVNEPLAKDAARYRKLRSVGAAPGGTLHLEKGLVYVTSNLDAWLDHYLDKGYPPAPSHAVEFPKGLPARVRDEQPKAENPKGLSPQGASPIGAAEAPELMGGSGFTLVHSADRIPEPFQSGFHPSRMEPAAHPDPTTGGEAPGRDEKRKPFETRPARRHELRSITDHLDYLRGAIDAGLTGGDEFVNGTTAEFILEILIHHERDLRHLMPNVGHDI